MPAARSAVRRWAVGERHELLAQAAPAQACRVVGSEADVWGLGVVQLIDAASMAIHLGYRHWAGDIDLVDVNGNAVTGSALRTSTASWAAPGSPSDPDHQNEFYEPGPLWPRFFF